MSCKFPFSFIEVFPNGDVYPCCPEYCHYYCFGNIYEKSIEEIWYSEKAVALRKRLLKDDNTVCNSAQCFCSTMDFLFADDEVLYEENPPLPIAVKLSHDRECNCTCITCRDEIIRETDAGLEELNKKIETHFLPLLRNARVVCLSGSGDPLFSRHSRLLIRRIAEQYPSIRFALHTNGQLCTPSLLENLGIDKRLSHVQISIHAATPQTYERIVRGASWQKLMDNLSNLKYQLDSGRLRKLDLFFVVQSLNVAEITQFVELASRFDATAYFWEYRYWGTTFGKDFDAVNVSSPAHSLHKTLVTELRKISQLPNVRLSPNLRQIAEAEEPLVSNPTAVFFHSFYRCASTYFFEKLRQKGTYCYYEPYNLELGSGTQSELLSLSSETLPHLKHPKTFLPYWMEFSPLRNGDGTVKNFHNEFHDNIYNYKVLPDDEVRYIKSLCDYSYKIKRMPVLGFIRSLLRLGLHKKYFNGLHIVLLRDPYSMFCSCLALKIFGRAHLDILRLAKDDSIIRRLGFEGLKSDELQGDMEVYSPDNWEAFCEFFVLFHAVALCHCDMVVDMTRLSIDNSYAEDRAKALSAATGLEFSFDDAAFPPGDEDIFYNPTPLRLAYQRYLGTASKRQKLIALAEEYADIPASPEAQANLDALAACIFRKTGETLPQQNYARWAESKFQTSSFRELQRLRSAFSESIPSDDGKTQQLYDKLSHQGEDLRQIFEKLDMLERRSLLKAEAKKIARRILPARIRTLLSQLRVRFRR